MTKSAQSALWNVTITREEIAFNISLKEAANRVKEVFKTYLGKNYIPPILDRGGLYATVLINV